MDLFNKKKKTEEVCLNLYYVHDDEGLIYSLRVHPYVLGGTEEEKTAFLRERALLDYQIAKSFPIPERFHIQVGSHKMPVEHISQLRLLDSPIALFEDAIRETEELFPGQHDMKIPDSPIVCVTPLYGDDDTDPIPHFEGTQRY
ncbi:MAG: hypothetical protein GY845_02295 [Planctomycetes bacterium]|nr:hypothetical protein [Planctomycetota bacterium]